jgi:hypothetical protein
LADLKKEATNFGKTGNPQVLKMFNGWWLRFLKSGMMIPFDYIFSVFFKNYKRERERYINIYNYIYIYIIWYICIIYGYDVYTHTYIHIYIYTI